jgi:hypothetical protein
MKFVSSGLVRFVALPLFASPLTLLGQAGIEYALKSAGSLLANGGSVNGSSAIAGCQVGPALLTCLSDSYPRAAILTGAVICLLFVRWLAGSIAYRARR